MVSTFDMSADLTAMKMYPVGSHWIAQFAGNDMSPVIPMLQLVEDDLHGPESLQTVSQAFARAYRYRLKAKIQTEILLPLGYTLESFKKNGLRQLGPEAFSRIFYDIQQQALELEVLVSGFDGEQPHIFTIKSPGKFSYFSQIGFWSIGSGQTNALGSFFNSKFPVRSLDHASILYRVCEAKFNAENALGVGHTTSVVVMYEDGRRFFPEHRDIEELRKIWETTRVLAVPDEARKKGAEILAGARLQKTNPGPRSSYDLLSAGATKRRMPKKRPKRSVAEKSKRKK